jgi:hypothetical protein
MARKEERPMVIRLPEKYRGWRAEFEKEAEDTHRSMNQLLISILEKHLQSKNGAKS